MALKDVWESGKQQRHHEHLQRQHTVQQLLLELNQVRQAQATQLHSELSQQDQVRRAEFHNFQIELQQSYQALQRETTEFLTAVTIDRILMAQELVQQLTAFHADLQDQVQSLRQAIQTDHQTRKLDVEQFLGQCQQQRQEASVNVQQDLRQSRQQREADVAAMFEQFVEFRSGLQRFHQALKQSVWGQVEPVAAQVEPATSPKSTTLQSIPLKTTPPRTVVSSKTSKNPGRPSLKSSPRASASARISPSAKPARAVAAVQDSVAFENDVYRFLNQSQGARLTQIESSLQINRFQAVDALRSLIKKGLITQRDRVYLVQEK